MIKDGSLPIAQTIGVIETASAIFVESVISPTIDLDVPTPHDDMSMCMTRHRHTIIQTDVPVAEAL